MPLYWYERSNTIFEQKRHGLTTNLSVPDFYELNIAWRVAGSALDLWHTTESVNWPTTTTGSTAADATFPPLSTNELAKVILKKKREKRVDRLNHDAPNHIQRGGGGEGGPDPPAKSQVIWVSIGKKQLDPPVKSWTPWKMFHPHWNHWTSVK